ncbi:J domain-containing protein [Eisenibacter elegans]|uniref:J domain-containing protein n=1 Tax=Eisenibacter elegans TaxID=997 RepID=UPI000425B951|nr:DnaJ domain-containing protein [Eisenibacter elegans]
MAEDYYQILGLDRQASAEDIKRAFKRLALQYHPDRNPDSPHAEEQFKRINEAYQTLSDEHKKWIYDLLGTAPAAATSPGPVYPEYTPPPPTYTPPSANNETQPLTKRARKRWYQLTVVFGLFFIVFAIYFHGWMNRYSARLNVSDAQEARAGGNYDEALGYLNSAKNFYPEYAAAHELEGDIYYENYQIYRYALKAYTKAIEYTDQPSPQLLFKAALSAYHTRQYTEAHQYLNQLIVLQPHNAEAYYYRARSQYALGYADTSVCNDMMRAAKAQVLDAQKYIELICSDVYR